MTHTPRIVIPEKMRIGQAIENFRRFLAGDSDPNYGMDVFYLSDKEFKKYWNRWLKSLNNKNKSMTKRII